MEDAPKTIREHLKTHGNYNAAEALRADESASVRFISSCLPDGAARFFREYVFQEGWRATAKRIFDEPAIDVAAKPPGSVRP